MSVLFKVSARRLVKTPGFTIVAVLMLVGLALLGLYRASRASRTVPTTPAATARPVPPPFAAAAISNTPLQTTLEPEAANRLIEPITMGGWTARPLASNPEVERQLARQRNGVNIDALYGGFYELARLTPEQRERFRNLRLDRGEDIDRLFKAASRQNSGGDRELAGTTLDVIKEDASAAFDQRIAEEFGPETLDLLRRYDSERSLRSISSQLADAMAHSSEPLSPAQSERLVRTFAAQAIASNGALDFSTVDMEQTLRAAEAFLSPGQAAALRPILESKVRAAKERLSPPGAVGR